MVLCLKTRESRSSPGLQSAEYPHHEIQRQAPNATAGRLTFTGSVDVGATSRDIPQPPPSEPSLGAGWSSPVARQAHNLKAAGSNPAPATKQSPNHSQQQKPREIGAFLVCAPRTRESFLFRAHGVKYVDRGPAHSGCDARKILRSNAHLQINVSSDIAIPVEKDISSVSAKSGKQSR